MDWPDEESDVNLILSPPIVLLCHASASAPPQCIVGEVVVLSGIHMYSVFSAASICRGAAVVPPMEW